MKISQNLAIGLALCLGLGACGQGSNKAALEPVDQALVVPNSPADQVKAQNETTDSQKALLESSAEKIRNDISKVKTDVAATTEAIGKNPEQDSELKTKLDQLNDQLKELKKQYAANQDALTDAEGYAMLLKFVIEHQVTSLDQLPVKFQDAKIELQKQVDEIRAQEESFLAKIEASINRLTEAKGVLMMTQRTLKAKAAVLKVKSQRTPEEQAQLDAIIAFLDSNTKLSDGKENLLAAQATVTRLETEIALVQLTRSNLLVEKTSLVRELLQVPANDPQRRDEILTKIEMVQEQLLVADLSIYDKQMELDASKEAIVEGQKNIDALKTKIDSLVPGLSSISHTDLAADMKAIDDAYMEFQTLQTDYQKWRHDLSAGEMALADISRLEAFFALKFPDIKPSEPA